jgi:hypothetical protein
MRARTGHSALLGTACVACGDVGVDGSHRGGGVVQVLGHDRSVTPEAEPDGGRVSVAPPAGLRGWTCKLRS